MEGPLEDHCQQYKKSPGEEDGAVGSPAESRPAGFPVIFGGDQILNFIEDGCDTFCRELWALF